MSLDSSRGYETVGFPKRTELTSCILWHGGMNAYGYGAIRDGSNVIGVHRLIYELFIGPIPLNMCVCHKCDVRNCINPEHLFLGSTAENNYDRHQKGRDGGGLISRFTVEQIEAIGKDSRILREIAQEYSTTISHIHRLKKKWDSQNLLKQHSAHE